MSGTEIALGILGSASALYGFGLAYYVFARTLHFMERDRYERVYWGADKTKRQFRIEEQWSSMSEEEFYLAARQYLYRNLAEIWRRGVKLDLFLLGATSAFIVSVSCSLIYLAAQMAEAQQLLLAILLGAGFVVLLACVSYVGLHVGYKNLKETRTAEADSSSKAKALMNEPSRKSVAGSPLDQEISARDDGHSRVALDRGRGR